jgi:hypothetical protein
LLDEAWHKEFHLIVTKLLYLLKLVRPETDHREFFVYQSTGSRLEQVRAYVGIPKG